MRRSITIGALAWLSPLAPIVASAQEGSQAGGGGNILTPNGGLMVWTLVIFGILVFVLSKFAFKPITEAVQAREKALEDAIEGAKRDREEAAKLLEEQRQQLSAARDEGQKIIANSRTAAEEVRHDMLEESRKQQQEMIDKARADINRERDNAIADLRREAVDLAILGASKVIEKNLDEKSNRELVEKFLASIDAKTLET
jgi:F-type H+-transporting ATPase subunit b